MLESRLNQDKGIETQHHVLYGYQQEQRNGTFLLACQKPNKENGRLPQPLQPTRWN
jgi:hypothetical protein